MRYTLIDAPTSTRLDSRRSGIYERRFKRSMDITMTSALIVVLPPVIIAVAIGVLFTEVATRCSRYASPRIARLQNNH